MAKVRSALLVAAALALGACGTTQGDRAATGAIIGGGTGGAIGLIFGGVGAGTGALTNPRQLDLGKPIWR